MVYLPAFGGFLWVNVGNYTENGHDFWGARNRCTPDLYSRNGSTAEVTLIAFWVQRAAKQDFVRPEDETLPLRKIQQIPGTDPRYPKIQIWQDFLHQQVVEGLGYVPGVCWSFLRLPLFPTVDGWNPVNSPVEGTVVEIPCIYQGFLHIQGGCLGFQTSTVLLTKNQVAI